MRLKELLKNQTNYQIKGPANPTITGLSDHSKSIKPGEIYVAIAGKTHDGRSFIDEALRAKASCVITNLYNPLLGPKVTQIITPDPRTLGRLLSFSFYKRPPYLIGVTGTNGKTTVAFLVQQLFTSLRIPCGLIGTCYTDTLISKQSASLTTPDGIAFARLLHEAALGGAKVLITEVSSHALDQNRLLGLHFNTVIMTNITHDHLDYHKTFEAYLQAKQKLFSPLYGQGSAILNLDDPHPIPTTRTFITYSLHNPKADLYLHPLELTLEGFEGTLHYKNKGYSLKAPLLGLFNASNLLAAIATTLAYTDTLLPILEALPHLKGAPGRLEKITPNILIDFAHTPDGLRSVLTTLKKLPFKKIRLVFGCGGDRDKTKRPFMGQIASEFADEIILTSDNPRHEDPLTIIEQIKEGLKSPAILLPNRKEALYYALENLDDSTCLLIAGKGHEKFQQIGSQNIPFDEVQILTERLKELGIISSSLPQDSRVGPP